MRIDSDGAVEIGAADGVGVLRIGSNNNNPSSNGIEGSNHKSKDIFFQT